MTGSARAAPAIRLHAILLYLLSIFLITTMSALIRHLSAEVPTGQIVFWRSFAALVPILGYMVLRGDFPAALTTRHPRLHLIRSGLGVLAMTLSFLSLRFLPVTNAQALAFLAPVFTLPIASRVAGERVTVIMILAVGLGMTGVLLMIGESLSAPGRRAAIGVLAGLGFALVQAIVRVHVRGMTRSERPATIAFSFALAGSVVGLATLPFGWATPGGETLAWLVAAGFLGGAAHVAATEAIAREQVSTLAPLEYTGLLWALGFDLVLFRHVPGPVALAGAVAILCAALLVTVWETDRGRTPPAR